MINLKLEGKEIAKSVVDLFSPLTEFIGAIGDQVRVYRSLSVLRTLKRAKQIAQEEGLVLEPPPLKFLIPFLEQSSLEDENDEVLSRLWANLLVSAGSQFKPEYNLFIRILNELSPREAQAFQFIAKNPEHDSYFGYKHLDDVESGWDDTYIYIGIRDLLKEFKKQPQEADYIEFEKQLKINMQPPGSFIYYFWVATGKKNQYPYEELYSSERTDFDDLFENTSFSMLKSLGLIGEFKSAEHWFGSQMFVLYAYYLTPLGGSFYTSCVNKQNHAPGRPNS